MNIKCGSICINQNSLAGYGFVTSSFPQSAECILTVSTNHFTESLSSVALLGTALHWNITQCPVKEETTWDGIRQQGDCVTEATHRRGRTWDAEEMSLLLTLRLILKPLWSDWLVLSANIVCVCNYVCVYALAGVEPCVESGSGKERRMSSTEMKWMSRLPGLNRIKCYTNQPVEPNQVSTLHPSCSTMGTGICWFYCSEDNTWVVVPWGTFSYKKKIKHK